MKNKKSIAFTFDDAPRYFDCNDNPTGIITDTLKFFGGKATFFLVGTALEKYGNKLIDEILKNDFEIANHTWSHRNLAELCEEEIKNEILDLQNKVKKDFGINMKYMRPPGLKASNTLFNVTSKLEMPVIYGSRGEAYLCDWDNNTEPEYVKEHCLNNVYPGQIVLMHSYSIPTSKVFFEICDNLSKQGYSFLTLSELFEEYGVTSLPCDRQLHDALF